MYKKHYQYYMVFSPKYLQWFTIICQLRDVIIRPNLAITNRNKIIMNRQLLIHPIKLIISNITTYYEISAHFGSFFGKHILPEISAFLDNSIISF